MRISDWSSDVCSSDLAQRPARRPPAVGDARRRHPQSGAADADADPPALHPGGAARLAGRPRRRVAGRGQGRPRSEEHTSELQSLMSISYAVFCLKKKTSNTIYNMKEILNTVRT